MSPATPVCLKGFSDRFCDTVPDRIRFSKPHLALSRMHVNIHCLWIHLQEKKGHRILAFHKRCMIPLAQPVLNRDIFHRSTVHKKDLFRFGGSAHPYFANKTGNGDPVESLSLDFQQLFKQLRSAEIPDAVPKCFRWRRLEEEALIAYRNEPHIRMANRLQRELVLDVTGLGVFAPEKFSTRRQIVEERPHLDLSAGRFPGDANGNYLAPIDKNLCSFQSFVKSG